MTPVQIGDAQGITATGSDHTAAIRAAIDYCIANKKPLSLDGLQLKVTATITISAFSPGINIDGKNAVIRWYGTNSRCFDVSGYDINLSNFRISNSGNDTTSVGMWFYARRSRIQNLQFFGGFTTCLEASQAIESVFEQVHVENYANADPAQRTGVCISLAHCLNLRIHGCYLSYSDTAIKHGTNIVGVTHGNEGIVITDNVCAVNNKQIDSNSNTWLAVNVSDNILDLASTAGIVLAGQNHIIHGNWIADNSLTGTSTTGVTLLNLTNASQVTVTDNTFWRGALASGTGSVNGIVGNGQQYSICNNQFNGTILNDALISLSSSGGFVTSGNIYTNGAVTIRATGTAINQSRFDPQRRAFIYGGLSVGTDTSAFGAVLSAMGVSGGSVTAAANFVNGLGLSQLKTDTVDQTVGVAWNAARACVYFGKDAPTSGATNRSINAAGTINASGADYAEYEKNNGLVIRKGSVVGFKNDGTLTLTMGEAIRFGVKSTDPSLVGGDNWGTSEVIGDEPKYPQFDDGDVTDQDIAEFKKQHAIWVNKLDEARQLVDRIAYAGKVPVNVFDAVPGGYIIADCDESGSIVGKFIVDPAFDEYKRVVGRVNKVLSDGRCEIAIVVH